MERERDISSSGGVASSMSEQMLALCVSANRVICRFVYFSEPKNMFPAESSQCQVVYVVKRLVGASEKTQSGFV